MVSTNSLKFLLVFNFIAIISLPFAWLISIDVLTDAGLATTIMNILFILNSTVVHCISYFLLLRGVNSDSFSRFLSYRYFLHGAIFSTIIVLPFTLYTFVFFNYYAVQGGNFLSYWLDSGLYSFQLIASIFFPIFIFRLFFSTSLHRWILNNFRIYIIVFLSLLIFPLLICWYLEVNIVNLIFFWFIHVFETTLDNQFSVGEQIEDKLDLKLLFALNPYQLFVCNYIFGFNAMMIVKKIISNESPDLIKEYYGKN